MIDVNKVILLGRLGANPILRQTKTGISVTRFSVATSRRIEKKTFPLPVAETLETENDFNFKSEESISPIDFNFEQEKTKEFQEETQWHSIVCWGNQANIAAAYLKKGHTVYIEGNIRTHTYKNQTGELKSSVEIHSEMISFLEKSKPDADEFMK